MAKSSCWASPSGLARHPIDTGILRNIGERLWAFATTSGRGDLSRNYSAGLTDATSTYAGVFRKSGKSPASWRSGRRSPDHMADNRRRRGVARSALRDLRHVNNGGYFLLRRQIFDYMSEARTWCWSRAAG
jgi:glucose-1-phosphate cytidylyltransferase